MSLRQTAKDGGIVARGPKVETVEVEASSVAMTVEEGSAREFMCVLGRRAVSSIHECLGSKCMAWRVDAVVEGRRYGYCGLAGRP
jgi:hypothetical protein